MAQALGSFVGSALGIFGAYYNARFQINKNKELEIEKARPVFNIAIGKFVKNDRWRFLSTDLRGQTLKAQTWTDSNSNYVLLEEYEAFFNKEDHALCINLLTKDRILDVKIAYDLCDESNNCVHNFGQYTYMEPDKAFCFLIPKHLQISQMSGQSLKCTLRISFTTLQRESRLYEYELSTGKKNSFLVNELKPIKQDRLTLRNSIEEKETSLNIAMDLKRPNAFFLQILNYLQSIKDDVRQGKELKLEAALFSNLKDIAWISDSNNEFDKFKKSFFQNDPELITTYQNLLNSLSTSSKSKEDFLKQLQKMVKFLSSKVVDI
ncbi:hypothetical protein R5R49_08750 [Oenococcus oeni]